MHTRLRLISELFAVIAALLCASVGLAQDSGPLIDLLVKKGLINTQEGEALRAELAKEAGAAPVATVAGGKSTRSLTISGRIQIQYAGLGASVDGAASNPVPTAHFFVRRVYIGAKADLGNNWSSNFNYDLSNSTFDCAMISWRRNDALAVDVGFRKVPFGLEEYFTSALNLKAIERSPADRYFAESNNGRRLGAASYRTGIFAGGKFDNGFFYNVAVTNPERDESTSLAGMAGSTTVTPGLSGGVQSTGSAANNNLSYWGNAGYKKIINGWTCTAAGSVGILPDQGGLVLGKGDNITVYSIWGTVARGPFDFEAEYLTGTDQHGISATRDAKPKGYWIQPAYKLTASLEAVVRFSEIYAGRRGVTISDGTRSAPSSAAMRSASEWFYGFNYFIHGNEVKLQAGYIHAESKEALNGTAASAKADGVRSQMQVIF